MKLLFSLALTTIALAACTSSTISTGKTYDFEKSGTLTRNSPGLTPGVWYLMYDEPSSPELSARLSFDEKSICIQAEKRGPCERDIFENNLKVAIKGTRQDVGVLVAEMKVE